MTTGAQPATTPLRVLLVGTEEEDFFLIREILERNRNMLPAELEHARSLAEAKEMLEGEPYELILFEHDAGDIEAVHLLADLLQSGRSVPFLLLTEDADENTVAEIIQSGAWNCITKSHLDGATLVRSIHNTLALHSLQQEQQSAESTLRKLSRAVEQSADTVVITDRHGVIEYVNPAFEALTGYSREDACGHTPRILKSGEQGPEFYQEMWKTILAGNVFRGILVNRKKMATCITSKKPSARYATQMGKLLISSRTVATSPSVCVWKRSCYKRKKWMPSAGLLEAWLTTSTIC